MATILQEPEVPVGRYRHYKGGEYEVVGDARHSETLERLAVYRSLADGRLWVRPTAMFLGTVVFGDGTVRRFAPVPCDTPFASRIELPAGVDRSVMRHRHFDESDGDGPAWVIYDYGPAGPRMIVARRFSVAGTVRFGGNGLMMTDAAISYEPDDPTPSEAKGGP